MCLERLKVIDRGKDERGNGVPFSRSIRDKREANAFV